MGYKLHAFDIADYDDHKHAEACGALYSTPANIESLHTNYGFADIREVADALIKCSGDDDHVVGIIEQDTFLTLDEIDDCFTDDNDLDDAIAEALLKKQKQKPAPRPECVAILHYYLTFHIIEWASEGESCVGDKFGIGEDDLVMQLWCYAEAIEKAWIEFERDRNAPGVFAYDVADGSAPKLMIEMMEHPNAIEDSLPALDEWQKKVNRLVDLYMGGREPKGDESILKFLEPTPEDVIDWGDLPDAFTHAAKDNHGQVWLFTAKPTVEPVEHGCWFCEKGSLLEVEKANLLMCNKANFVFNKPWHQSLVSREDTKDVTKQ